MMQLPCCVALGSWDLQVKALGHMARRQAWGSTLFPQITYAGIKKNNIKTDLPLLLQLFHVVLQPRSLAQPCCSFRSAFKNYLCTLPQSSTYMTLQVSNLSKPKASTFCLSITAWIKLWKIFPKNAWGTIPFSMTEAVSVPVPLTTLRI